jgi:DNA-binding LacI/PurR family transcriptional regulator
MERTNGRAEGGKWFEASLRLQQEMEAGRWKPGEHLPGPSWLCDYLGVTPPTLRKLMRRLVEIGCVEPLARGWRVRSVGSLVGGIRIALLRYCDEDGVSVGEAARETFFRRALEQEAARMRMRIETWGMSEDGRLFREGQPFPGELDAAAEGAILSLWRFERPDAAFQRLATLRLPLAIWDERPQGGRRPDFWRCRWFTTGYSKLPGREVGRFLLELGHRGVAFLSPFHGSQWSQRRLDGLTEVCALAEPPVTVREFTTDRWDPSQYNPRDEDVAALVRGVAECSGPFLAERAAMISEAVEALLRDKAVLVDVEEMCAAALDDPALTAWVAANDDVALLAWYWLRSHGMTVGKDISLVGFDNTLRAQEAGLTSFGFAEDELAVAMLGYLASPSRWKSGGSLALGGSLVVRQSTKAPRSSAHGG